MANPEIDNYVQPNSPKEILYQGVKVEYSLDKLRLLAGTARKREFSTTETRAFLCLYEEELKDKLNQTIREFVQEKLK
jgi:hypothetical protein